MEKKYNFLFYYAGTKINYIPSSEFYSIINRLSSITQNKVIVDLIDYNFTKISKDEFIYYYKNIDKFIDIYFPKLKLVGFKVDYFIANNMWFNESIPEILLIAKSLKKIYKTKVIIASEFMKYYGEFIEKFYGDCLDYYMDGGDARYISEEKIFSIIKGDEDYFNKYISNLDKINGYNQSPDFSHVFGKTDIVEFEISRGCKTSPKCFYCGASNIKSFHSRSIKSNLKLLKQVITNGIIKIYFADNEINFNNEYLEQLLENIIKNKIFIKWSCYVLAKNIGYNLIQKMYSAGCRHIKIGIESVTEKRMKTMSKNINVNEIEKVLSYFHRVGVITQAHFMFNFKDETIDELKNTMKFIEKNIYNIDIVDFHYLKFRPKNNATKFFKFKKFDVPFIPDNYYISIDGNIKQAFSDVDNLFNKKYELLSKFLIKIGKQKTNGSLGTDPKEFFKNYN